MPARMAGSGQGRRGSVGSRRTEKTSARPADPAVAADDEVVQVAPAGCPRCHAVAADDEVVHAAVVGRRRCRRSRRSRLFRDVHRCGAVRRGAVGKTVVGSRDQMGALGGERGRERRLSAGIDRHGVQQGRTVEESHTEPARSECRTVDRRDQIDRLSDGRLIRHCHHCGRRPHRLSPGLRREHQQPGQRHESQHDAAGTPPVLRFHCTPAHSSFKCRVDHAEEVIGPCTDAASKALDAQYGNRDHPLVVVHSTVEAARRFGYGLVTVGDAILRPDAQWPCF